MKNIILKMIILAVFVFTLSGCATALVHTAGMDYEKQELKEAYLEDKDSLVIKTDEDIISLYFKLNDKTEKIDNFSFVKNENTNLHRILTNKKSEVQTFSLQREYHSIRDDRKKSPGTKLEILGDDRLTSLDKPIIYLPPKQYIQNSYYLILNSAEGTQIIKLPSLPPRKEESQPAWWPLKLPLYPPAAAIDVAVFPLALPMVILMMHNFEGLAR